MFECSGSGLCESSKNDGENIIYALNCFQADLSLFSLLKKKLEDLSACRFEQN